MREDFLRRNVQLLKNCVDAVGKAVALVGTGFLLLMMFMVVGEVFCRSFFNIPIPGAVEMSELALLIIVFFSASYTFTVGGHVSVEIVRNRLPRRIRTLATCFALVVSLVTFGMLVYGGVKFAWRLWELNQATIILGLPIAPFVFVIPGAVFILWLRLLVELFLSAFEIGGASNDSGFKH